MNENNENNENDNQSYPDLNTFKENIEICVNGPNSKSADYDQSYTFYDKVFNFVRHNRKLDYKTILKEYGEKEIVKEIEFIVNSKNEEELDNQLFCQCARKNFLNLTKYLIRRFEINKKVNEIDINYLRDFAKNAVKHADLKYFEYMHEKFGINLMDSLNLEDTSCKHNKIEILKFLFEKRYQIKEKCINEACEAGNLEIIKFLVIEKKFKLNGDHLTSAINANNFECVEYICEQLSINNSSPKEENIFEKFIRPLFCRNEDEAYESTSGCNTGDSKVMDNHYDLARRNASDQILRLIGSYRNSPYNQQN